MASSTAARTGLPGTTVFVDTEEAVRTMVRILAGLPTTPPELYIDLEGTNLCREGTLSIVTIHVRSTQETYIVDVTTLKHRAFDTPAVVSPDNTNIPVGVTARPDETSERNDPAIDSVAALTAKVAVTTLETSIDSNPQNQDKPEPGPTLRAILESRTIPKVFFDVRNDSDALFAHYSVSLGGVHDAQLMEVATRGYRRFLHGLARCIAQDAGLGWQQAAAWQQVKDQGKLLFDLHDRDAARGAATVGVFDRRPMPEVLQRYCVNDVVYLPRLRDKYWGLLSETWRRMVLDESAARVRESQASDYRPQGRQKAEAPAAWNW